jgi:anaerobic selenocysteine-containing dehydrogenase
VGSRAPYGAGQPWPVRVDQHLAEGVDEADVERWVESASVLHSNGDGIDVAVKQGRIVGVRGRARDRVNHGRLDPKDLYGWQANASPDRLTAPLMRERGELVETDWDTAVGRIVERSRELLELPGGSGRIGFYTSGQLFLEDRIRVRSRRGVVEAPARIGGARPGVVFIPFHYGYWDGGEARAANELTLTSWDPVSKQPVFKVAAVRVEG